jgi:hypothetical protein
MVIRAFSWALLRAGVRYERGAKSARGTFL